MRKPRTTTLLLAAIVALLGCASALWTGVFSHKNAVHEARLAAGLQLVNPSAVVSGGRNSAIEVVPTQTLVAMAQKTVTISPLSPDANALFVEMCGLHLMARDADLSLSSQEWSAFASVVLRTQAIRQTYEAQIATSHLISAGHYQLEIPAYAGVGDALREKFHADLKTELGEARTAEVLAKLGEQLEGRFAGFGVSMQTLDVMAGQGGTRDDLEVTRTVTYWNAAGDSDKLTTRHEVHFPAVEDPTGDSWSALLAMVKA